MREEIQSKVIKVISVSLSITILEMCITVITSSRRKVICVATNPLHKVIFALLIFNGDVNQQAGHCSNTERNTETWNLLSCWNCLGQGIEYFIIPLYLDQQCHLTVDLRLV